MNNKQIRWAYLIILSLIWGSSFILMKKALLGLTPVQVGALRIIITAISLMLVSFKSIFIISKKEWFYIFITSILGTFFPAFFFAFALEHIDSSIASILNSLTPLNTLIVGALFFGFSFLRKQIFGIVLGLAGAVFLIYTGSQINPSQNYAYAFLIVFASVGYAFNVNILKKHLSNLHALTITTANFVLLIIPSLFILWKSDFFKVAYTDTIQESLIYIAILAVFGTAFAKTMFNRLVQISSPIFSSSVTYLIPLVAIFWGVLDGEKLSFVQVIAGVVILIGIYLTNKSE